MQTLKKYLVLTVIAVAIVGAQIVNPSGSTVTGAVNNAEATSTRPMREVVGDPSGACSVNGEIVSNPANAKLFKCVSGTWEEIAGSGGGSTSYKVVFGLNASPTGTAYFHPSANSFSATQNQRLFVLPVSGTARNLHVYNNGGQSAGTTVCTLMKNSGGTTALADTSLAATIDSTAGIESDTVNTVAVTALDTATLKCVNSGTGAPALFWATFEIN